MWRQRALELSTHWQGGRGRNRSPLTRGRLLSDAIPPSPPSPTSRSTPREGHWTKKLLKEEEKDPAR